MDGFVDDPVAIVRTWVILALPLVLGAVALRRGWPIVGALVLVAFAWNVFRNLREAEADIGTLGTINMVMAFLGLAVGGVAQAIYSLVGKNR